MKRKILVIAIALLFVAIVAAPVAAMPAVKRLVSPAPLTPSNNALFTNGDHLVMLEWQPVADARVSDYLVEVQGWSESWDIWSSFSSTPRVTTDTWYQVDCFPVGDSLSGFNTYRWRVTARSSVGGCDSLPSKWSTFSFAYTEPDTRLATVRLVSPVSKSTFRPGSVQSYQWELVPGAGQYILIHEKKNANNEWQTYGGNPTVVFGADPAFPFTVGYMDGGRAFTYPGTYRWRVIATGAGDYSGAWSASPWRTYTVT